MMDLISLGKLLITFVKSPVGTPIAFVALALFRIGSMHLSTKSRQQNHSIRSPVQSCTELGFPFRNVCFIGI